VKLRSTLGIAIGLGLILSGLGTAQAGLRPVTKTFFLHYSSTAAGDCGNTYVDLKDTLDEGNGCGYIAQPINEVLHQAGQGLAADWPDTSGAKFKLNTSKPIKAAIAVNDFSGLGATAGEGILDLEISASVGGKSVTLLKQSKTMTLTPVARVFEFSKKLPKKFHRKLVTGVSVRTLVHGVSTTWFVDTEAPPSKVMIPGFK
jgi:hypothetical protein